MCNEHQYSNVLLVQCRRLLVVIYAFSHSRFFASYNTIKVVYSNIITYEINQRKIYCSPFDTRSPASPALTCRGRTNRARDPMQIVHPLGKQNTLDPTFWSLMFYLTNNSKLVSNACLLQFHISPCSSVCMLEITRRPLKVLKSCFCKRFPSCLNLY